MKTFLALAASALLAWAVAAPAVAAPPANLSITAERGQPFSLVLDGQLLTNPVARQIRVGLLLPGRHWAEISVPTGYGPALRMRTSVWLQPGVETSYVLLLRPYGPQLRQVAIGPIGQPGYGNQGGYYGQGQGGYYGQSQPGGYYGQGQQGGGYYGQNQAPAPSQGGYYGQGQAPGQGGYDPRATYPGGNQPGSYPAPVPNQQGGYAAPMPAPNPQGGYVPPTQPGAYGQNNQGGYNNAPGAYPNDGSYPAPAGAALPPLAPADVAELAQELRQLPTEAERLRAATDALAESSLRADELAELVKTFTHDESRIELGRFGYAHVSDPQNFERVYEALQFPSSVRTLRQFIGQSQH